MQVLHCDGQHQFVTARMRPLVSTFLACKNDVLAAQVPRQWNSTTVPFRQNVCLHRLFEAQASAAPNAECLVYEGTVMTYGQMDMQTNQLAHYLRSLRVDRDVPVAVLMERSLDLVMAVMGMSC